jgi:RES domain-containing protein
VKGLIPTIYASLDPDTLNAEAYHKGRRYGWTQSDFLAQLRIGMHWQLQLTLNLTEPVVRRALNVRTAEILNCDWPTEQNAGREALTQAIARAAFENLAEGLVVPSARHQGGVNVVYYPSNRRAGTVIDVLDPGNLPPDMHGLAP